MKMKRFIVTLFFFSIISCKEDDPIPSEYEILKTYQKGEELLIGKFSIDNEGQLSFTKPLSEMTRRQEIDFKIGKRIFRTNWVPAPASTTGLDGLGPTFNAKSCGKCHVREGRGLPLEKSGNESLGFLMRLSVPGQDIHGGPNPVIGYGGQLQTTGILDIKGEANLNVIYEYIQKKYPDGTPYELRKPIYTITNPHYGVLPADLMTSPRVGQQTIGLGFLDALSENEILKNADENDANGDGISGRANYVWDIREQKVKIGKFGWKANVSTLEQQIASAFHQDIGLTTSIFPNQNCPDPQNSCQKLPNGNNKSFEVPDFELSKITFYQATLGVPKRRNYKNKNVLEGKALFHKLNCITCHSIGLKVEKSEIFPKMNGTVINPYSDFLLHDMGEELADNRPDFLANGKEWRTQPLWGIGLINTVNNHTFLLHDGRARNIEEAILWHGGESEKSKKEFMNLTKKERQQVLDFVKSL